MSCPLPPSLGPRDPWSRHLLQTPPGSPGSLGEGALRPDRLRGGGWEKMSPVSQPSGPEGDPKQGHMATRALGSLRQHMARTGPRGWTQQGPQAQSPSCPLSWKFTQTPQPLPCLLPSPTFETYQHCGPFVLQAHMLFPTSVPLCAASPAGLTSLVPSPRSANSSHPLRLPLAGSPPESPLLPGSEALCYHDTFIHLHLGFKHHVAVIRL